MTPWPLESDESMVAQWLAHWPLVLEVPGSIPDGGKENLVYQHASLRVICRDDMNSVRSPLDWDVTWRPPVQGQSSAVQFKDHNTGSNLKHVGSSYKHLQCTPSKNNKKLMQKEGKTNH